MASALRGSFEIRRGTAGWKTRSVSTVMRVEVVVVGGGHNGLAMSKRLSDRGIDHVVLERGEVGELVADRALGLVHAPHAELAEPDSPARSTTATTRTAS